MKIFVLVLVVKQYEMAANNVHFQKTIRKIL